MTSQRCQEGKFSMAASLRPARRRASRLGGGLGLAQDIGDGGADDFDHAGGDLDLELGVPRPG